MGLFYAPWPLRLAMLAVNPPPPQEADRLAAFPGLSRRPQQSLRATGTDEAVPAEKRLGVFPATFMPSMSSGGRRNGDTLESVSGVRIAVSAKNTPPGSVCTSGDGPGLQNQVADSV